MTVLRFCGACGKGLGRQTHDHPDREATYRERLEEEAHMFGYQDRADMDEHFVADLLERLGGRKEVKR